MPCGLILCLGDTLDRTATTHVDVYLTSVKGFGKTRLVRTYLHLGNTS